MTKKLAYEHKRDAAISGVFNTVTQPGVRSICIYLNAKSRFGAYTSLRGPVKTGPFLLRGTSVYSPRDNGVTPVESRQLSGIGQQKGEAGSMATRTGYHYSDWDYADNETVVRSWDINLTPEQLKAEAIIRDHHPEGPEPA